MKFIVIILLISLIVLFIFELKQISILDLLSNKRGKSKHHICHMKDIIMNTLTQKFNENIELKNSSVFLFDKQTYVEKKTNTEEIKHQIRFLDNLTYDSDIASCLKELNDSGCIKIIPNAPEFAETENQIIYTERYYCTYITELGRMKMKNGGFVKEYTDESIRKYNKFYAGLTLFLTALLTIVELIKIFTK